MPGVKPESATLTAEPEAVDERFGEIVSVLLPLANVDDNPHVNVTAVDAPFDDTVPLMVADVF